MTKLLEFRNRRARQRGQMAIFVALIFQVLFVLFAMSINIALIVHDKINLQNAVDFAAYYAAQRQAEILNVMAHQNYAIRQSWKLLTWRYRALGTSGVDTGNEHPWRSGAAAEEPYIPDLGSQPAICVTHSRNWNLPNVRDKKENLCKRSLTRIPSLPDVPIISPLGFNAIFSVFAARMKTNMLDSCRDLAGLNWWYAMVIMQAFREDQRNRKLLIYELARDLSEGPRGDFKDLDGNSVFEGSRTTFSKNLTFTNRNSVISFEFHNSLSKVPREVWLQDILINPTAIYVDPRTPGGNCDGEQRALDRKPPHLGFGKLESDPTFGITELKFWMDTGSAFLTSQQMREYQYSMGVEKNPWVMAYVGVKAVTKPEQIFYPFGPTVLLSARSFAKPFGGRIGPWYGSRWPGSSPQSIGDVTDELLPPRVDPNGISNVQDERRIANYSRFPGDKLGLKSKLAINSLQDVFSSPNPNGEVRKVFEHDWFKNIWRPMFLGGYNDPLAFDNSGAKLPPVRQFEIAAVAPDLFDVTYYSIEPHFGVNYLPRLLKNRDQLGIRSDLPIRGDLGQNGTRPDLANFSVQDQMDIAQGLGKIDPPPGPLQKKEAFYFIRDKVNLLTSWSTGSVLYKYDFPFDRFGQCGKTDDEFQDVAFKVPGSCAQLGGRTGYSVRFISRDYLKSDEHMIGGKGESPGRILNPPPEGW